MPGAIVPVSGELYGTSRVGSGTAGAWRAGFLGGAGGFAPTSCAGAARCVSGSAGTGCTGFARWRAAAIFALIFCTCSVRSEEHTSELQSPCNLVCRLLLEKKKNRTHPCLYP